MTDLTGFLSPELLAQLGDAVTVIDREWRYRYASPGALLLIGRPLGEVVGAGVWDLFPQVVGTPQYDSCVRVMQDRVAERITWFFETVGGWYEQRVLPAGDGLVVVVDEVTEQVLSARRSAQLLSIGEGLAGATTAEEVNRVVLDLAVPLVGASGGGVLLGDDERGVLRVVGWGGMDEQFVAQWSEYPLTLDTAGTTAYRTGEPVWIETIADAEERYPDAVDELLRLGRHTLAALPLASAGQRLGVLVVSFATDRVLSTGDRQFLSTTAAMTAQALLRAALLDAEKRSITALQRSLLPGSLPAVEGLDVTARYAASDAAAQVGGDWYDVVALPGGAVALVMGDVEGHDLQAAALMGLVRSAVRAYTLDGHPPAVVLGRANSFLAGLALGRIVTLAYAHLHPVDGLVITVSAGHLPLLVAPVEGDITEVPAQIGPPLGVQDDGLHWLETTSTLPAGAVLALYTDGLVESRRADIDEGQRRLRAVLGAQRYLPLDALADALLAVRGESHDDVALLLARLTAEHATRRRLRRRLPATPASVVLARRATRQLLEVWDVAADVAHAAEVVVTELVTNAARHSEDGLELRLALTDDVLRVEVEDTSHRMPTLPDPAADEDATSGRGLVLVGAVAQRWGVLSEDLAKTVWAEFDLRPGHVPEG